MRPTTDIGAAVIGGGFIGAAHIEALRRLNVPVRGLLGRTHDAGSQRAGELGVTRAYASLEELLADPAVDVVHVASPNALHYPQVRQILRAGRHVVCEKPLATTSVESAVLAAEARAAGVVAAVNFNLRFYPINQHVRQLVAEGGIGAPRTKGAGGTPSAYRIGSGGGLPRRHAPDPRGYRPAVPPGWKPSNQTPRDPLPARFCRNAEIGTVGRWTVVDPTREYLTRSKGGHAGQVEIENRSNFTQRCLWQPDVAHVTTILFKRDDNFFTF